MNNVLAFFLVVLMFVAPLFAPMAAFADDVVAKPLTGSIEMPQSPIVMQTIARANSLGLSEREEWRRLLHYRQGFLGGWKSEAAGSNFFVAPLGRTEPRKELEADIAGFFSVEKRALEGRKQPAESVRCQFPARFEWLDQQLHLSELVPAQKCPEWDEFRNRVDAISLTLVFSSFYAGNPSSTYGHSLMRMNKSDGSKGSEHQQLLDYGVNYAANQTSSNAVVYAVSGLFGLFQGSFTNIPYYYKVREYADFESRDLWEYDLDLKPDEVARAVAHLWELGSTTFDYYYLNQNCSYHMLTLIEAAAPRTHLVNRVPWWVIPTDSVKAFVEDGLVKKTNFRASLQSQFQRRVDHLSSSEETELRSLVANDRETKHPSTLLPSATFAPDARARIADAYMDYVDLHYAEQIYKKNEAYTLPKEKLLIERSHLPMTPALDFTETPVADPTLSHPSGRLMLTRSENQNYGGATDFAVRFALDDLIDPPKGLPENADIDFFHLELRLWDKPSALRIENAVLFGIGTYAPITPYVQKGSWRAKLGLQRIDDPRCYNCTAGGVWGGYGFAANFVKPVMTYAMVDVEAMTSPDFSESKFSLRGGPTLGARVRFSEHLAWLTEARYFWAVTKPQFDDYLIDSRARFAFAGDRWGVDLRSVWRTENREVTLGVLHYF